MPLLGDVDDGGNDDNAMDGVGDGGPRVPLTELDAVHTVPLIHFITLLNPSNSNDNRCNER
jgi:hypothetical protein